MNTRLPLDIDTAWEMLHAPAVFRHVSAPFTVFRTPVDQALPERFVADTDYLVTVYGGGVVPLGSQIIRLVDTVDSWAKREVVDGGRGVSGMLSVLRNWHHSMSLEAAPDGSTFFRDRLTVNASWLTPVMWLGFGVFWRWRALRLRRLAQKMASQSGDNWNRRYSQRERVWSGEPNPILVSVTQDLTPGRALDIGCGEGADALWLAENGWSVHAVDASAVAVFRAHSEQVRREAASGEPLGITWKVADVDRDQVSGQTFDLVSLQFLHLEPAERQRVWDRAKNAVAPGGTLLIVGHGHTDADLNIPRPPLPLLFDSSVFDLLQEEDWDEWDVREEQRTLEAEGSATTVTDVYLVAKR